MGNKGINGEDEELIVKTVKEIVEGNEIYAKYFDSSRIWMKTLIILFKRVK